MQIFKYSVGIPLLNYLINAYLVVLPNGQAMLVDTGMDTDAMWEALCTTMRKAGIGWKNIKYIMLTHGHADHFGMAARILERTPAVVFIHSSDRPKAVSESELWSGWRCQMIKMLLDHGMPAETAGSLLAVDYFWHNMFKMIPEQAIRVIEAQSRLELDGLTLDAIHSPGHTLGSCCFFVQKENILFSGDALLPDTLPNPQVEFGFGDAKIYQGINQIRETMSTLRRLAPDKVFPGHGETITNMTDLIDRQLQSMITRGERILGLLDERPLNTFEATNRLFKATPAVKKLFAFSEAIGYLGWLESEGIIKRQQSSGEVRWAKVRQA